MKSIRTVGPDGMARCIAFYDPFQAIEASCKPIARLRLKRFYRIIGGK